MWRVRKEVARATDTVDLLRRMFAAYEARPCLGAENASGAFEWRSFGAVYDHAKKVKWCECVCEFVLLAVSDYPVLRFYVMLRVTHIRLHVHCKPWAPCLVMRYSSI